MIRSTSAAILGPAIGGLIVVAVGPSAAYMINLVTFTASLALLVTLHADPRSAEAHVASFAGGLRYARSRPDLLGTYAVDLLAMAWAYPVVMLPFVAARYHVTYALSLLYLGLPVGALLATVTSGGPTACTATGARIAAAATLWGLGIAFFGYATSLWLCFAGTWSWAGADAVSGIFRQTMWNESIAPDVRGRMAGVELISYAVGPTAGQFRAGVVTAWTTLRVSLTFGGLGCAGSVVAVSTGLRQMWRFDARTDVNVEAVRALRSGETGPSTESPYARPMAGATYLITVSGPDRVGVGAELWASLARLGDRAAAQRRRPDHDSRLPGPVRGGLGRRGTDRRGIRAALALQRVEGEGLSASVERVEPGAVGDGRRLLVTLLAPSISAEHLREVFSAIAAQGATCERIVHLADYPVDCYQLVVRGLDHAALRNDLTLVARATGIDLAVQRAGLHRRAKHLVVMDADSTLLHDEVIDLLADECGCAKEVAAVTEAAMVGEIDFAESLRRRVALLEGLPASVLDDVRARLRLAPGARTLLRTLRRLGDALAVVSGRLRRGPGAAAGRPRGGPVRGEPP